MTTAAYLRVSSKGQNLAMQRNAIAKAAGARSHRIVRWYAEKVSAGLAQRPQLEVLRAAVRAGKVGRLYVWRLDRLSRRGIRETLDIVEELRSHGCELVTIADGFDLQGPAAEVVLAVLAWAAEMERRAIGERISAARERVLAAGGTWGRPRRMTTREIARARALADKGSSVREIAVALKVPRATVHRMLRSAMQ